MSIRGYAKRLQMAKFMQTGDIEDIGKRIIDLLDEAVTRGHDDYRIVYDPRASRHPARSPSSPRA